MVLSTEKFKESDIHTSDGKRSFMMNFNMKAMTSHILTDKKRQSHLMLLYFISIHWQLLS